MNLKQNKNKSSQNASMLKIFSENIWKNNPVLTLMLGLCAVLAVSTEVKNALGMGCAMTFVVLCSNIIISAFRNSIPEKIRIPVFVIIIASFTVIADLVIRAFFSVIHENLGIFIPLIVANCLVMAKAEVVASKNGVAFSIADALGMGLGYTIARTALAAVREVLGNGTFLGIAIYKGIIPVSVMIMAPGSFITLGLIIAVARCIRSGR